MLISGIVAKVSILDHAEMDVRLFRRIVVMKRTIDIKRGLLMSCIFVIHLPYYSRLISIQL